MKRKRKKIKGSIQVNKENAEPSSTEEEQEDNKKVKIDQSCALPLQAIKENEILDTSTAVKETERRTRTRATKKPQSASQPTRQQPKRMTRSSRKKALEETECSLEIPCVEKEEAQTQRATRKRKSRNSSKTSSSSETPEVVGPEKKSTISFEMAKTTEEHLMTCKAEEGNPIKEHVITENLPDSSTTTKPMHKDQSSDEQQPTKERQGSQEDGGKSEVFVPDTPEQPGRSTSASRKICKATINVVLAPVEMQHLTPVQGDQDIQESYKEVENTTESKKSELTTQNNKEEEAIIVESAVISEAVVSSTKEASVKESAKWKAEKESEVSSSVRTRQTRRSSREVSSKVEAVGEKTESTEVSTTTEELPYGKETKQDHKVDTGDSKLDTDSVTVASIVEVPKKTVRESNKRKKGSRRSSRLSSKKLMPRSLTKAKSTLKTRSLVKSSVKLQLSKTRLMPPTEEQEEIPSSNFSPESSSDPEIRPPLSEVKQDLFGALQTTESAGDKNQTPSSSGSESSSANSDGIDGKSYTTCTSQENKDEDSDDVFHDAKEDLEGGAAISNKG